MKKFKVKFFWTYIIRLGIGISILLFDLLTTNQFKYLKLIGLFDVIYSIYMIVYYRNVGTFSWIVGIISLINICWANSICFNSASNAFNWQIALVDSPENVIMAKCYISFFSGFLLGSGEKNKYNTKFQLIGFETFNLLIFFGGILLLIYILIFGFSRSSMVYGHYISQSNTIYEYGIVLFTFVWLYLGRVDKINVSKICLLIYATLYIFQGLIFGDRSSAFPMIIVLIILLYKKDVRTKDILLFGIGGVMLANYIDLFRNSSNNITLATLLRLGLNVNTISYSHYAGVQIISASNSTIHLGHFCRYLLGCVIGGNESLADYASSIGYFNRGGGFSSSYFYYWFGYVGALFGGFIFGKIIEIIFTTKNRFSYPLMICIVAFTIRWYVYFPVSFFRSSLIVPTIIYLVLNEFDKIFKIKTINN